jgi:hypothetical protein
MKVKRVASVVLGFEDEAPVLRQWRQAFGAVRELSIHAELPGNIELLGPYVDRIE